MTEEPWGRAPDHDSTGGRTAFWATWAWATWQAGLRRVSVHWPPRESAFALCWESTGDGTKPPAWVSKRLPIETQEERDFLWTWLHPARTDGA